MPPLQFLQLEILHPLISMAQTRLVFGSFFDVLTFYSSVLVTGSVGQIGTGNFVIEYVIIYTVLTELVAELRRRYGRNNVIAGGNLLVSSTTK